CIRDATVTGVQTCALPIWKNKGGAGMAVDTRVIERTITIEASPETVFRLLTDPVQYVRWKGRIAELEPTKGGTFRVQFADPKQRSEERRVGRGCGLPREGL